MSSSRKTAAIELPGDNQIKKLERAWERATDSLSKARRRRNDTSPTGKLPNEVLSLIFVEAFRSQTSKRRRTDGVPLNVASVSARWREVALSTPVIWSRIDFFWRQSSAFAVKAAACAMLKEVFTRSKISPIDFYLHEPRSYCLDDADDEAFGLSVELLISNASRCRSFTLHVETPHSISSRFHEPKVNLPALQELTLLHAGDPLNIVGHYSLLVPPPMIKHALTSLTLSHIGLLLDDDESLLKGLRSLKLRDSFIRPRQDNDPESVYKCESHDVRTLQKARDLEELEIQCLRDMDDDDTYLLIQYGETAKLEFPKLKRLSVILRGPGERMTDFLGYFVLPSLQSLTVARCNDKVRPPDDGVQTVLLDFRNLQFLVQGGETAAPLQEIRLEGCSFQARALEEFLSKTPQLRILRLGSCTVEDLFLKSLAQLTADGLPKLCPNLKTLSIQDPLSAEDSEFPELYAPFRFESLHAMLRARHSSGNQHEYQIMDLWLSPDPYPFKKRQADSLADYVVKLCYHRLDVPIGADAVHGLMPVEDF